MPSDLYTSFYTHGITEQAQALGRGLDRPDAETMFLVASRQASRLAFALGSYSWFQAVAGYLAGAEGFWATENDEPLPGPPHITQPVPGTDITITGRRKPRGR